VIDYRESTLALVDILVNGEKVDALSQIVHRDTARPRALRACERLKEEIPRQMFKIAIQGAIGGEIISVRRFPLSVKTLHPSATAVTLPVSENF